jgi:hypothetical protein
MVVTAVPVVEHQMPPQRAVQEIHLLFLHLKVIMEEPPTAGVAALLLLVVLRPLLKQAVRGLHRLFLGHL